LKVALRGPFKVWVNSS